MLGWIAAAFILVAGAFTLFLQGKRYEKDISERDEYILRVAHMLNAKDIYRCDLYVQVCYGKEQDLSAVDFSHYEENKIIYICKNVKKSASTAEEKEVDGRLFLFEDAIIYRLGGEYSWLT